MADQDQPTTTQETTNFLQSTEGEPAQVKAEDLVGEGKKFESTDALAYGKEMADRHITTLEAENQRLRNQIEASENQGDLIKELKEEMSKGTTSIQEEVTIPSSETPIATQDLSQQVRQVLEEERRVNASNANLAVVKDRMIQQFGESWSDQGELIASNSGLSMNDLNSLAAKSPEAFFKLAGLEVPKDINQPSGVRGTINTEAVVTNPASSRKNKAYYTAMRKEMGDSKFFSDTRLQNEIMENADALT